MLDNSNENIRNGILLEFAKTLELFDLSPIEARVFSYLYVERDPLTLDDMTDALGKSKTSISNSVRGLEELNLVKKVWKRGVRKDLYQANRQLFKQFIGLYKKKWVNATNDRREAFSELEQNLNQQPISEQDENLEETLKNLLDFHHELERFFQQVVKIDKNGL